MDPIGPVNPVGPVDPVDPVGLEDPVDSPLETGELTVSARQNISECYTPWSLESLYNATIFISYFFTYLYIAVKNASIYILLLNSLILLLCVDVLCYTCDVWGLKVN